MLKISLKFPMPDKAFPKDWPKGASLFNSSLLGFMPPQPTLVIFKEDHFT